MPRIKYEDHNFGAARLALIEQANEIIADYQEQGLTLTLRQLYYRFVAGGLIENTQKSYKRIGDVVNKGRLAGLIDWNAIEDRTRNLISVNHWNSPAEIIEACASQFRIDKWEGQPFRPEVWVEKEALAGVLEPACRDLDIPFFACRGYVSQSEMWSHGRRLKRTRRAGSRPVIIHLGDHDPSGIDMTRDIHDRQLLFEGAEAVERIALNFDQIEEFSPPPNPAKLTDSRADAYIAEFGRESWELDALEPRELVRLVRTTVERFRDDDLFAARQEIEDQMRARLQETSETWED